MPAGNYYLKEEEELLETLWYNKGFSSNDISKIMGRSTAALRAKARSLGWEARDTLEGMWRVEEIKQRMQEVIEA